MGCTSPAALRVVAAVPSPAPLTPAPKCSRFVGGRSEIQVLEGLASPSCGQAAAHSALGLRLGMRGRAAMVATSPTLAAGPKGARRT